MRKYMRNVMIAFLLLALLRPLRALAASGDGLRLDQGGTVTVVSQHAAKEEVSSLCFSLSVESANAARVEFEFEDSRAKIKDFRYDQATGSLKVYLAGTEALFAEGTEALAVGKIKVLDGSGNEVTATVSAVENSLQYVYGTEAVTMQGVELPDAVQIGPAAVQPQPPSEPQPPAQPQPPSEPQPPAQPQAPVATQAPVALLPQFSVVQPTARPTYTPRATASPRPTEAPDSLLAGSQPPESESWQPEKDPSEDVPVLEEDIFPPSSLPGDGNDSQATDEDSGGEDSEREDSGGVGIFVVIAVVVVLIVVVIEVMAFVVLKKPHGSGRRRRRGSGN